MAVFGNHPPYEGFKEYCRAKQITYKRIGDIIGTRPEAVMNKVNGISDFSLTQVKMICEELNLPYTIFFNPEVSQTITFGAINYEN